MAEEGTITTNPADWRSEATIDVPRAGREALGLGRNASYDAAARGDLPVIRIGGRIRVPVAALRRLLGELPPLQADGEVA